MSSSTAIDEQVSATRIQKKAQGFSLIELLATLMVMALLLGAGVPAYESLVQDNRMVTNINELSSAIQFARSEALKRGVSVRVCIPNNGNLNASGCSNGSDWSAGWNVRVVGAGGLVLRRRAPLDGLETLDEIGTVANDGRITFDRLGFTADVKTIVACNVDNEAPRARGIIINAVGQVRTSGDSNGDGTVEDATGANVACP